MEVKHNKGKRGKKEHQLIAFIEGRNKDTRYGGSWAGKEFFRLKVQVVSPKKHKYLKEILAFKDRILNNNLETKEEKQEREQIWKEILEDNYFDRRLLLICSAHSNSFSLIKWKDKPLKNK